MILGYCSCTTRTDNSSCCSLIIVIGNNVYNVIALHSIFSNGSRTKFKV